VLAPSGVPKEILYRLNQEINRILNKPDLRERLATQGAQVEGSTPEAFATVFHDESLKWSRLTRSLALPLQ
ncbi:MAG: tripartite tricarboxylate transporter substrate-binding protein, partial [Betaproteobacteria bacterium]